MNRNACTTKLLLLVYSFCMLWTIVHNYRLPKSIVPEHYTLNINTYLDDDFSFAGNVLIKIRVLQSTNNITLHASDLEIDHNKVILTQLEYDIKEIPIRDYKIDKENEFYILLLNDNLQKDSNYTLYIPFKGNLTEGLAGYYRSSYLDRKTGEKKWLATTQFESIDARRGFPCFDEPEMKAVYKISLGHLNKYRSISNMPVEKTDEIGDNWVIDHFQETVRMSTYLIAYIVSDFDYKYGDNVTDAVFRVWARKDAINQVDYAANIGPKFLEFFENYFDIKYPLPKQDMVAIPDFSAGAMENWGLITYRETALLFDPKISDTSSRHRVASVIAHELAHQWFGNLVTMKWWTDLWLNEGFATFMAAKAVHHVNPEWNSLNSENVENLLAIYTLDRLISSHPISVPIGHPSEIAQIFDAISYKKGSFMLRMMNLFLSEDVFRRGVSNYLNKYAYGNAEKDDLWDALTKEAHKQGTLDRTFDVKTIMDTWTIQTGYPIITVTREDGILRLQQERFVIGAKTKSASCWWVPLSYTTAIESNFNDTTPKAWLKCDQLSKSPLDLTIARNVPSDNEWVLFNIQSAGLYKVNYDNHNWELLIKALLEDYHTIPILNRVQLIDDAMDLANAGLLSYNISCKLLTYLVSEDEYLAWNVAFDHLNFLNTMLKRKSVYGLFEEYIKQLVTPIYEKISYELAEKSVEAIKRQVLISAWACRFNIGDCEEQSVKLFKKWMTDKNSEKFSPIPKDLRAVVFCTAIKSGGEKEWEFLWQKYLKSNVGSEKQTMLHSLGCTSRTWLLNRYLDWSLNATTGIRKQDMLDVFNTVSKNPIGFYLAKDFLKTNVEAINKYLGPKSGRIARYLKIIARQMQTELELKEFKEFVNQNNHVFKNIKLGIEQSIENIQMNIAWQDKHYNEVRTLFEKMNE